MRVLWVCVDDWANAAFHYSRALQSVGIDSEAITEKLHGFDYPQQSRKVPRSKWPKYFEKADVIINMHSQNLSGPLPGKHVLVFYGGSSYRQNPVGWNSIHNKWVDCSIIQTADLLGCGAKNEAWVLPPIDLDTIRPKFGIWGDTVKIAHYPRSLIDKGGVTINSVMEKLLRDPRLCPNFVYAFDDKHVPWKDSISRMSECDIYVEAMSPTVQGKKHGVWGMTALEAAALGKIVVTNDCYAELYQKHYGSCALQIANTEAQLEAVLRKLITTSHDVLENLQVDSREWVERNHSYEAVGKRLKAALDHFCYGKKTAASSSTFLPLRINTSGYDPKAYWESRGHLHACVTDTIREELYQAFSWLYHRGLNKKSILEVGQGHGATYLFFRDAGAKFTDYKMVDFVQSCRYKAKQMTGILPDGWDGKLLPYSDDEFETLICTDVMLHVPDCDIGDFVRECARVAKQFMIVSTYTGKINEKSGDVSGHTFIHDYDALWKENNLQVLSKKITAGGKRAIWLLQKTTK